jgi:hypothetical protein
MEFYSRRILGGEGGLGIILDGEKQGRDEQN